MPSRQQGGSAPSRYHAPDSGSSEPVLSQGAVTSSAGLIPQPPWPLFPSLPTLKAAAPARSVAETSPQSPSRGGDPVPAPEPTAVHVARSSIFGSQAAQSVWKPDRVRVEGVTRGERRAARGGRWAEEGEGRAQERRPPGSGARPGSWPRPAPPRPARLPLPLHPGEGVPETAPILTPPPRFPGSSLRRRSSTMPDSFDTLQRQRPEEGERRGRGGERGERGDVSWERGECSGHPLLILLRIPSSPEAQETFACLRPW